MEIEDIIKEIAERHPEAIEEVKKDLAFHIGSMVARARMLMGMTQKELAEKIGTKQPAIARIELGNSLPSLTVLDKIAKEAFGSYLIPPRFAFMKPDTFFAEQGASPAAIRAGMESSTFNRIVSPLSVSYAPTGIALVGSI